MAASGWKIGYVNRAECYEEAPESWPVRKRQIVRWAMGHTECLHRLGGEVWSSRFMSRFEKLDAIFVLGCYWTVPILVMGWLASLVLLFSPQAHQVPIFAVALSLVGYQLFGSQATFFEMGAAALLDGKSRPADLVPLNLVNFFASTGAICEALLRYYSGRIFGSPGPGGTRPSVIGKPVFIVGTEPETAMGTGTEMAENSCTFREPTAYTAAGWRSVNNNGADPLDFSGVYWSGRKDHLPALLLRAQPLAPSARTGN